MSLSINLSSPDYAVPVNYQLGSANGWNAVCEWAQSLPDNWGSAKVVREFTSTGKYTDTEKLAVALEETVFNYPRSKPTPVNVRDTIEKLVKVIEEGSPFESIEVVQ